MSMEKFLRDIEARLASERAWDMEQDARQVARVQYSTITLDDRLLAQVGGPIRICATDMQTYEGKLEMVGEEWVSIEARGENIIIPLRGMLWWARRYSPRTLPHENSARPPLPRHGARTRPPLPRGWHRQLRRRDRASRCRLP